MSHYPYNPITNRFSHRNKSRLHGILQIIGGSMALLGGLGKFLSTEIHFTTWHGRFGKFLQQQKKKSKICIQFHSSLQVWLPVACV